MVLHGGSDGCIWGYSIPLCDSSTIMLGSGNWAPSADDSADLGHSSDCLTVRSKLKHGPHTEESWMVASRHKVALPTKFDHHAEHPVDNFRTY